MIEDNKENTIRTESCYSYSDSENNADHDIDTRSDKLKDSTHSTGVVFSTYTKSSSIPSNSISESSLSLSESETDEIDFHPEMFGLLDNPGV